MASGVYSVFTASGVAGWEASPKTYLLGLRCGMGGFSPGDLWDPRSEMGSFRVLGF